MKEWLKDLRRSLSPDLPWMNRDGLQQAYTVIALAFITGIMPMPYEFYTTLSVEFIRGLYGRIWLAG